MKIQNSRNQPETIDLKDENGKDCQIRISLNAIVDCITLNVPSMSLSNVPGISE